MTTIDEMLIKGIRSFDPENKYSIIFFRPLTLFVGRNGSGKTTIMECLKLACTGQLPPNSRSGHTFLYDPRVSGETDIEGQIKLQFKTAVGRDVVVIRSYKLKQMVESTALESILQTINPHTEEKVCLRSGDVDKEIPALMRVSKAILENVVFVHHDDSTWPVQDPSTLKKKFDDIFSATWYSKSLKVTEKLHKKQPWKLEYCKLKLETLQTLKDAADELRDIISQEQEESESLKVQINELERDIQAIEGKILPTITTLEELQKLEDQISASTSVRSFLYDYQHTHYATVAKENEASEERIAMLQSEVCKLERELNDEEINEAKLSKKIKNSVRKIVKLQVEDDAHSELVNERALKIRMILKEHNLGKVPKQSFCDKVAAKLLKRIKTRLEKDLQDKKKSNEIELKFLWERSIKAIHQCIEIEVNKKVKIGIKAGIIKKIEAKENEREIAKHELDKLKLRNIDKKEKKLKVKFDQMTNVLSSRNFESIITHKKAEVHSLEQQIISLKQDRYMTDNDVKDVDNLLITKKKELGSCLEKVKQLWLEIESLKDEWQMLEDNHSSVMMRYHSAREKKLKAKDTIEKLNEVEKDLLSLAEEKSRVDLDEAHLATAIGPSLKEKEKLMQEYVEGKIKLGREYDAQTKKKRKFMEEHGKIQELSSKIKKYIDSGKQEKLNDLQEKVAFLKSCREKCKFRKVELSSELSRTKELLLNSRNKLQRCVDDGSNYRMIEEDIESLSREIDMLEEKKASIGSLTAFETELERQEQEKERLVSKLSRCRGTLSGCQSSISEHKRVFEESQYTDIDKRYFNQLTKVSEMEKKNLARYDSALEKAFMRFHSKKMEKLNNIIRELWQQTCGGQDYISILSYANGAGTCSYSYRTVMQTRNGGIDMYGRCSSSQKALASLIVRIALAETFCHDCGILALDEPTAGLDEPSADRFAAALLRIMEERRGQENFQLIVTTYDEDFARLIGRRQYAEKYYRVTKPDNRSIVEPQEIFDL